MKWGVYTRSALTGFSDGITLPLVTASALTGAWVKQETILLILTILTVAGAFLLGLANYFTIREEGKERSHSPAFTEMQALPQHEKGRAIEQIVKEQQSWRMDSAFPAQSLSPLKSAVTVFIFFGFGGCLLLLPYYFSDFPHTALSISAVMALLLLFITGSIKSKLNNKNPLAGAVRLILISATAAAAVYGAAVLFRLH
jgi:VIT1/CCC1 family predicted Fe2+/Mn2+ transporter